MWFWILLLTHAACIFAGLYVGTHKDKLAQEAADEVKKL